MKLLKLPLLLLLPHLTFTISIDPQQSLYDPALASSSSSSKLLALHKSLVEIESITGHEHDVAQYLVDYLTLQGLTVETQVVGPGLDGRGKRQNLLAYIGQQRKTKVLVSSHIDTVPPFWPYKRKGEEIWGRGTVDAKGSVAAQIIAFEEVWKAGKLGKGDVALLFVVGEEVGGDGMKKANDFGLKWDTVIFGEPTELKLASGHKGISGMVITAKGKAGHSGYPELGRNAIAMLVPALNELLKAELPWSEEYGNTTLNFGTIEGGVAANVIAEEARAQVSIRIADGDPADVEKVLLDAIQKAGQELDVEFHPGYGPIYIDSDVPGFKTIVVNYGTDIPNLKGDHKRYLYGPGTILMAHSDHEHLKISDLETAVKGYKALIEHSLK
ncbi:Zn-dependent exopeptidase [Hyaloscypha variabilis F]|uniref:Zn-dependent exopeptidase n=1 Tax=Hyaloscypha variabilis (strain UAMH 11265 / GT02V1 / F) TaxID=1149755 RepID=A0A2J6RMM6_HYAVF|nr:Zn-dependent exopeptidase [Hyaloscypha variabilis F]